MRRSVGTVEDRALLCIRRARFPVLPERIGAIFGSQVLRRRAICSAFGVFRLLLALVQLPAQFAEPLFLRAALRLNASFLVLFEKFAQLQRLLWQNVFFPHSVVHVAAALLIHPETPFLPLLVDLPEMLQPVLHILAELLLIRKAAAQLQHAVEGRVVAVHLDGLQIVKISVVHIIVGQIFQAPRIGGKIVLPDLFRRAFLAGVAAFVEVGIELIQRRISLPAHDIVHADADHVALFIVSVRTQQPLVFFLHHARRRPVLARRVAVFQLLKHLDARVLFQCAPVLLAEFIVQLLVRQRAEPGFRRLLPLK